MPEEKILDSLELREEIRHGGSVYFLQTSLIHENRQIQSSFFRNGTVFDTIIQGFDGMTSPESLKELTKSVHNQNKKRFQFLLDVRERITNSNDPAGHLKLARALAARNLHLEAIAEAENAIQKGARDSGPYLVTAQAWYNMGDYDNALTAIRKGIELSPDFPDLHNLIGKIYIKQRMCREAVDSFRRAVSLNLYYGEPYLNLVKAYLLNSIIKQDYEISRDIDEKFSSNIKRAMQLNPFLDSAKIEQSRTLFMEDRLEEALDVLENLKDNPLKATAEDVILELYLILMQSAEKIPEDDIERYLETMRQIVDQNPTFADAHNSLGILYTAKCKILMDKASQAFGNALEINPDYEKAQKNQRLTENDRQGVFILLKALLD